ncbi:MAG: acpS [Bacteroidetes bacterium]|jgi:holo-[acyl-carrier protein] synthase|nr:acpS [Bacteroidota bacterium]
MIRGIGVDIVDIGRVRNVIEREEMRFLEKVFTDTEIAYCNAKHNRCQHFAARFAAKEAVSKALATGWAGDFRWKNVEVTNDASGQPHVTVHGGLKEQLGSSRILISLSHADLHVVAVAVIEDAQ